VGFANPSFAQDAAQRMGTRAHYTHGDTALSIFPDAVKWLEPRCAAILRRNGCAGLGFSLYTVRKNALEHNAGGCNGKAELPEYLGNVNYIAKHCSFT
jgi:hypothetical protein